MATFGCVGPYACLPMSNALVKYASASSNSPLAWTCRHGQRRKGIKTWVDVARKLNTTAAHQRRGKCPPLLLRRYFFFLLYFFNLTYSRWTSSLPSCLWSLRIFPSLPGSRLTIFYRDASSALLQLVNQWLNFTSSRSHAFRYERKNTNPTLVRIELTTSALAGVQVTY